MMVSAIFDEIFVGALSVGLGGMFMVIANLVSQKVYEDDCLMFAVSFIMSLSMWFLYYLYEGVWMWGALIFICVTHILLMGLISSMRVDEAGDMDE
ncbi:MAG: hypothetical protein ACTSPB_00330 [Candidatus Thorarchaeota archaeon]